MEKDKQSSQPLSDSELQLHPLNHESEPGERRFRANPDFILREIAGEAVLIPVGEAGIFENSYEDPEDEMEQGIYSFIEDYVKYGLLKEE